MTVARLCRVLFLVGAAAGITAPADAQWYPPIGIPAPSFGITQTAPPAPNPWTNQVPGFYYVEQRSGATNVNNPYGTPAKPRISIPNPIPAGSVVELHGFYDVPQSSPNTLVAQGTAASPVFLRGASSSARPLIRQNWEIKGSYLIMENLEFGPTPSGSVTGSLVILSPASYVALRHSELHGTLDDGGLGIENWNGPSSRSDNIVIWGNFFHDNGDVNAPVDQDVEGIHVGSHQSYVWIVDNEMARNSGDGIQINAGEDYKSTTHHIFVGRNVSHHNKQGGFWVKQAVDVIFSQNTAYSHRPGNSSLGHCLGGQYAPDYVWWLYNRAFDCEYGIALFSDWEDGQITHQFFVGNVISGIHSTTPGVEPDDPWSPAGITVSGGYERHFVNNTFNDVDSGINVTAHGGSAEVKNNIITNLSQGGGNHVNIGFASVALTMDHNLFFPNPRVGFDGTNYLLGAVQMAQLKSVAKDPLFRSAPAGDFHIGTNSPAAGAGEISAIYATYQQRYGVSILVDADYRVRSQALMDIGAYAASGVSGLPPSDEIVFDMGGQGVLVRYSNATTTPLHAQSPDAMVSADLDGNGTNDLIAAFRGFGVWVWMNNSTWFQLHAVDATSIVTGDLDGNGRFDVLINFQGLGVWVLMNNATWFQLNDQNPSRMITADLDGGGRAEAILDFPGQGVWVYQNHTSWLQLHVMNVSGMAAGDMDGNGRSDLLLDFPGSGIWVWWNNLNWSQLHAMNASVMAVGDVDGNGKADAFITFPGWGVWAWMNNRGWTHPHGIDGTLMVAADIDHSGRSDILISFPGFGVWGWMNNSGWVQISAQNPESMTTGNLDGI